MSDQETYSETAARAFAKALFAHTDEPDEPDDDKETVTPEPADDDHQFTRLLFNPTEGN